MTLPVDFSAGPFFLLNKMYFLQSLLYLQKVKYRKNTPTITSAANTEKPRATLFQDKLEASDISHEENGIYMGPLNK